VASGVPDFRSANGLYSLYVLDSLFILINRIAKEFPSIQDPKAMFTLEFFLKDPSLFYSFASKIYAENLVPTLAHFFIKTLEVNNKLLRNYTQNIDALESEIGIQRVFQCHGSFDSATCMTCSVKFDGKMIQPCYLSRMVAYCDLCVKDERFPAPASYGLVKPDIVFFGEDLPGFEEAFSKDCSEVDLLIVIGSSLQVDPVAENIFNVVPSSVPKVLINLEAAGQYDVFDSYLLGDCQQICGHILNRLSRILTMDLSVAKKLPGFSHFECQDRLPKQILYQKYVLFPTYPGGKESLDRKLSALREHDELLRQHLTNFSEAFSPRVSNISRSKIPQVSLPSPPKRITQSLASPKPSVSETSFPNRTCAKLNLDSVRGIKDSMDLDTIDDRVQDLSSYPEDLFSFSSSADRFPVSVIQKIEGPEVTQYYIRWSSPPLFSEESRNFFFIHVFDFLDLFLMNAFPEFMKAQKANIGQRVQRYKRMHYNLKKRVESQAAEKKSFSKSELKRKLQKQSQRKLSNEQQEQNGSKNSSEFNPEIPDSVNEIEIDVSPVVEQEQEEEEEGIYFVERIIDKKLVQEPDGSVFFLVLANNSSCCSFLSGIEYDGKAIRQMKIHGNQVSHFSPCCSKLRFLVENLETCQELIEQFERLAKKKISRTK